MSTANHPLNSFTLSKEEEIIAEKDEMDAELYYGGNEIEPYSLEDLEIEEVDRVIAVDSYGNLAEEVKDISKMENVLTVIGDDPLKLEEALSEITEPDEDEIRYIITNKPHSEYIIESYSEGKMVERTVTDDYNQAKELVQAKVLGASLETFDAIDEARSNLEELYERIEEIRDYDSSAEISRQEIQDVRGSLAEVEESIVKAESHLEKDQDQGNSLKSCQEEVRAISANKEMALSEVEEILEGQRGISPSVRSGLTHSD